MLALVLATTCFPRRRHFAVIDAGMLEKYQVLAKVGFIGIDPGTRSGAAAFLRAGEAILSEPDTMLWVTAQGEFTDSRSRPVRLRPGVAHLARRCPRASILPLALELTYWNERAPEGLAAFGPALPLIPHVSARTIHRELEAALESLQDRLARAARTRDEANFEVVLRRRIGIENAYDAARWVEAKLLRRAFEASHGSSPRTVQASPAIQREGRR